MSHNQDQHYIEKVILGDTNAFSVLIDRYKHMVFTLALKIIKNREDAEEVAQDVFLKAYRVLETFKGDSKFSTWLYKIAYYKSLDYLKKNKRTVSTTQIDISDEYNIPSFDNALEAMEAVERKATIMEALKELSEEDNVLSKITGVQANTIKVRIFRSRKRLAEILKNRLEPETILSYGGK
jgi:RNA polymerase sigma-70 factor (ECF subfamily)